MLKEINEMANQKELPASIKTILDKTFADITKEIKISRSKRIKDDAEFLQRVRKNVSNDRTAKITLLRLKKLNNGKEYDDKIIDAIKEVSGKLVSEFQLQDYAIKKDIFYKGYENYIFDVDNFFKVTVNHDKLDYDFMQMQKLQYFMDENYKKKVLKEIVE